ncbi:MAG: zinc-ribbon domain-containing protein [Desulfovibrio sp.]|jgi:predicted Zn finger-like uncharacterized protein|nr:zinc-ribbon domain-containing protein [Desulfovibrio sp.]
MLVTCPRCETTFFLPDELFKPGKKARCSNCHNVFPLYVQPVVQPAPATEDLPPLPPGGREAGGRKVRSGKALSAVFALAAAVLLVLLGYGGYLVYGALFSAPDGTPPQAASGPGGNAQADYERRINSIALEEIRQFHVNNAAAGRIMVIQGLAVNRSDRDKDYIAVEACLLDPSNKVLAKTEQLCGVPLTLFQLQSLGVMELKEALNSRVTILTNNTNVPPGGKTPFVIVFPSPPKGVQTFEVRVIEARDSPVRRQDGQASD